MFFFKKKYKNTDFQVIWCATMVDKPLAALKKETNILIDELFSNKYKEYFF